MDLDNEQRVISSPLWHKFCYQSVHGSNEGTKDEYSSVTWAAIRRSAGIEKGDCKRKLTVREALIVFVRANLDSICKDLKLQKPKSSEMSVWTPTGVLSKIVNAYLDKLNPETLSQKLGEAIALSEMSGTNIVQFIQVFQGGIGQVPLGERRIREIIKQSTKVQLKKTEKYPYSTAQKMIQSVINR
ncbi:MAG: hypothetical protein ACRC62_15395 [Microcoleus sp.]